MGIKGDLGLQGDLGPEGPRGPPGVKGVKGELCQSISAPSLLLPFLRRKGKSSRGFEFWRENGLAARLVRNGSVQP